MAIKVGTDIVSIDRIAKSIKKFGDKFLDRYLSKEEQKLSNKIESYAGYWAAKEAIAKALGVGIGNKLSFLDIEIKKTDNKVPYFEIKNRKFNIIDSSLSITHDGGFAVAVVVLVLE